VQRASHEFLAAAALPLDKDGERRRRGPLDPAAKLDDGFTDPEEIAGPWSDRSRPSNQERRQDRRSGHRGHRQNIGRAGKIIGGAERPAYGNSAERLTAVADRNCSL
jgi:hypothetical protein